MISRLASAERYDVTHAVPRWLASAAAATIFIGALTYAFVEITQGPRPVEAPGFLTRVNDGQMQIAAYVPPTHPEFAISGERATVIFPDGSERIAVIARPAESGLALPHREMYGDVQLGTLVRMEFIDEGADAPMLAGLPVKVHFESPRPR